MVHVWVTGVLARDLDRHASYGLSRGTAALMEGPGRTGQCHAGDVLDRGEKFDLEYHQV